MKKKLVFLCFVVLGLIVSLRLYSKHTSLQYLLPDNIEALTNNDGEEEWKIVRLPNSQSHDFYGKVPTITKFDNFVNDISISALLLALGKTFPVFGNASGFIYVTCEDFFGLDTHWRYDWYTCCVTGYTGACYPYAPDKNHNGACTVNEKGIYSY